MLSRDHCIIHVGFALACEPELQRLVRPRFRGELRYQFVLPLGLCPPSNVQLRKNVAGQPRKIGKMKREVAEYMALQCSRRKTPLRGRPQVLAVRFSSVEPDRYSDWAKWPIDVLCKRTARHTRRLNIIEDDRPSCAEIHQWWEPAKRREGFVYIEVRS